MKLLGKKAEFVPAFKTRNPDSGTVKEDAIPVVGVISYVNREHGWFCVSFRAGDTIQREGFKFCEIGERVEVHG